MLDCCNAWCITHDASPVCQWDWICCRRCQLGRAAAGCHRWRPLTTRVFLPRYVQEMHPSVLDFTNIADNCFVVRPQHFSLPLDVVCNLGSAHARCTACFAARWMGGRFCHSPSCLERSVPCNAGHRPAVPSASAAAAATAATAAACSSKPNSSRLLCIPLCGAFLFGTARCALGRWNLA